MPSQDRSLPTWWLKIWIAIGCFAFALFVGVPVLMSHDIKVEYDRFQACVAHHTDDCKPSMIWLLSGWSVASSTSSGVNMTTTSTASVPPVATSTNMGAEASSTLKVLSIDLDGVSVDSGQYTVNKVGQKVSLHVKVQNAKRVELFVWDPVTQTSDADFPKTPVVVLGVQKDGSYAGNWIYPKNLHGIAMLTVRAYSSSKGSAEKNAAFDGDSVSVAIKK